MKKKLSTLLTNELAIFQRHQLRMASMPSPKLLVKIEKVKALKKTKSIKKKEIWIIFGSDGFGMRDVICGYEEETEAKSFLRECDKYNKAKPIFGYSAKDLKAERQWERKHPAGKKGICKAYFCYAIPYIESSKKD